MRETAHALETFYASPLGGAAQHMVGRRLQTLWPDLAGQNVLGFGYSWPHLRPFLKSANRVVLAMPEDQGALAHENKRGVMTCLTHEDLLPFSDATFDHILCIHAIEEASDLPSLLRELWRVTQPEGRIVVIAANRGGLWARSDAVPFGAGRPFSKRQLRAALSKAGFQPTVWSGALYMPPWEKLARPKIMNGFERFGETVWPSFSGVVLVEAMKRLYAEPEGLEPNLVRRPKFGTTPVANREGANRVKDTGPKTLGPKR